MTNYLEYSNGEKERIKLQLVCKRWADLLERRKIRFVGPLHQWNRFGNKITRLDLKMDHLSLPVGAMGPSPIIDSIAATHGQVASLRILGIRKANRISCSSVNEFFQEHIMRHADKLQGVQSLVLAAESIIAPQCIMDIRISLSQLTFLHLEGDIAYGTLVLERLDILYLNVMPANPQAWSFPSLRHLALGAKYLRDRGLDLDLIPATTDRLVSLLLPATHNAIHADYLFWNRLSSLQLLGISLHSLIIVESPPPKYPLRHLCVTEAFSDKTLGTSKVDIKYLNVKRFTDTVSRMPLLKFVTLPTVLDARKDRYSAEWRAIFVRPEAEVLSGWMSVGTVLTLLRGYGKGGSLSGKSMRRTFFCATAA